MSRHSVPDEELEQPLGVGGVGDTPVITVLIIELQQGILGTEITVTKGGKEKNPTDSSKRPLMELTTALK